MFKFIGIYTGACIYATAFLVYIIAFAIVKYILGFKVEFSTNSFDKLFECYGTEKDSD